MSNATTEPAKTGELELKGGKAGKHKKLDGTTVDERPDPLVTERARDYGDTLDAIEDWKTKAENRYAALQDAFKKSRRQRRVTVQTEHNVYEFWMETSTRIKKKRITPVK